MTISVLRHQASLVLSLALGLGLAACDDDDTDSTSTATTTSTTGASGTGSEVSGQDSQTTTTNNTTTGTGGPSLGGADGITAILNGTLYAFTMNPLHVPQQTPTVLISASSETDTWAIRMLPQLGTQSCNGSAEAGDPAVSFRSLSNLDLNGTTGTTGACSITITSLAPKYEGSFTATIVTSAGNFEATEGYFRIAN